MSKAINKTLPIRLSVPSLEQVLRWGIMAGVYLILLTPFVVHNGSVFPNLYPKVIYFRVLVEVIFLLYLFLLLRNLRYLPRLTLLFLSVLVFIEILLFSTWKGINPERSFWGSVERGEGFILLLHLFLFFAVLVGVFGEKKDWMRFIRFAVLASIPLGVWGLREFFSYAGEGYTYMQVSFGNPIFYGAYLVFIVFLSLFLAAHDYSNREPTTLKFLRLRHVAFLKRGIDIIKQKSWIVFALVAVFSIFLVMMTLSRAAWVATGAGFVVLAIGWVLLLSKETGKAQIRQALLFGIFLILLFFLALLLLTKAGYLPENPVTTRYEALWHNVLGENDSRFRVWRLSWEAWKDSPIFGYGLDSFSYIYDLYYRADMLEVIPETLFFDRAHNKVLDLLVFSGLIGLASYLSLFALASRALWKYGKAQFSRGLSLPLLALLAAYFTQTLLSIETIGPYIMLFFVLAFVDANFRPPATFDTTKVVGGKPSSVPAKDWRQPFLNRDKLFVLPKFVLPKGVVAAIAVFATVTAAYVLWSANIRPYEGSLHLTEAHRAFGNGESDKGFMAVASALASPEFLLPEFSYYVSENLFYAQQLPFFRDREVALRFIEEMLKTARMLEEQVEGKAEVLQMRSYLLLARVYTSLYFITSDLKYLDEEERILGKAIELNPEYLLSYRLAGKMKFLQGKKDEGLVLFAKAYEADQDLAKFSEWMGGSFLDIGERESGADLFRRALRLSGFYTKGKFKIERVWEISDIYEKAGKYDKMADFYEEVLRHYPDDKPHPQLYASLSQVYKVLGDKAKARETTERMLKLYPGFREQADEFLSTLEE